ncbi:tryptophan-rich sensory protein [Zunongwangia endophytica]|uniref:Tryptophan-rich sensory protein n=1 Tax=Zunongwangia endophytica TaxID=1808945 RepID=A0ABV8H6Z9_9FLAO|nr:tryptophan-rich sensory protein [Zunongwangia endophytica]MDN3595732.1 tryptophan-rich sensory protein [Zunongwangia endophytica]
MKPKLLAVLNFISVLIALFVSYYTQAVELNGNTMGSLSKEYFNLFTPAPYAFAIWGIIYLGLLSFSGYQIYQAFGSQNDLKFLQQTKLWFVLANLSTSAWVIFWLYEYTGLSVFLMFLILFSLIKIILNTNMERWDAPLKIIAFSWWPICFYSGWIAVATIANISAYLAKIGWNGGIFSEVQWAIIMIVVAAILNIVMIYTRNLREFAAVGIWALFAIYMRHSEEQTLIAYVALGGAILIGINCAYHGFINRKENPMYRMFN